jgi:hypothetical protein
VIMVSCATSYIRNAEDKVERLAQPSVDPTDQRPDLRESIG